ncbi:MAG: PQQ-binding-like beta-propeller repeat protein [Prolixibacteraceae bacterium]|nr:PQQ-binding-like beta-propeller repeat protein [Prolixibacteraceae bacterium]
MKNSIFKGLFILTFLISVTAISAQDWPMWRYDAGRTSSSPAELPDNLHLQWTRHYSPREMVWDDPLNHDLMQFDKVFEPIAVGNTLYIGFNDQDKVVAINSTTGNEIWSFYADGPVRLPLSYDNNNIYFTSDDGYLYCLSAEKGDLNWKFRGGPADRKLLGNKRLISTWPARGGVVVDDGVAYFAASIWPSMGTFIYAIDAKNGEIIWKNDGTSSDYILQPHGGAMAFAGIAPQGPMTLNNDYLFIAGGRSVPGCFDRKTGELIYYHINAYNKSGGAFVCAKGDYFVNHHRDRNTFLYESESGKRVSQILEKYPVLDDEVFYFSGESVVARDPKNPGEILWSLPVDASGDLIQAGSHLFAGGKNSISAVQLNKNAEPTVLWKKEVDGNIGRLIAANGKIFAVTLDGKIMALGATAPNEVADILPTSNKIKISNSIYEKAEKILNETKVKDGYALYIGVNNPKLLAAIAEKSNLTIVAVDSDVSKIDKLRKDFDEMGFTASRVAFLQNTPENMDFAPYFSSLTIIEDIDNYSSESAKTLLKKVYASTRPFGGKIWIGGNNSGLANILNFAKESSFDGLTVTNSSSEKVLLAFEGAPEGSANWTHLYGDIANTVKSDDDLVKLPLGVLWFGGNSNMDVLPRHGHGPPEQIIDGKLIIQGNNSLSARDVYTGRVLWKKEFETLNNYGVFFNESYVDDPLNPAYNQEHLPGTNTRGTNYIVTNDLVYVAQGIACQVLDIETGEKIKTMWMPDRAQCAYLGVSENNLITGGNFARFSTQIRKNLKSKEDIDTFIELIEANNTRSGGMYEYGLSASSDLVVADRHDLKVKWKSTSNYGFIHNAITASDDVVYVLDKLPAAMLSLLSRRGIELEGDYSLTALNVETGDTIWQNKTNVFGSWLRYSKEHDIVLQATRPSRDMVKGEFGERMIAHRASDGTIIWDKEIEYGNPPIIHGERIIVENHAYDLKTGNIINRVDPITGEEIVWEYTRTYGCNYIIGSENLLSFRSGAAGFYDLETNGGTGNLGGFKSGCTANLIAANGVLNAPDYTRTCACSYQNQTSLSFIHMPRLEYWTNNEFDWSGKPVQQLGINFGAPGDRVAENSTLWLDYPSVGGKSPDVPVDIKFVTSDTTLIGQHKTLSNDANENKIGYIRTNSFNIETENHSYVAASAINGVQEIEVTISNEEKPNMSYTVKLYFAEIENTKAESREFNVDIQGETVLEEFNITKEAGGQNKLITKTFEGIKIADKLNIKLNSSNNETLPLLSGLEILMENKEEFSEVLK